MSKTEDIEVFLEALRQTVERRKSLVLQSSTELREIINNGDFSSRERHAIGDVSQLLYQRGLKGERTLSDISALTSDDILGIRRFSHKKLRAVKDLLRCAGLKLRRKGKIK